ncbi:conserved hypothetical protein [Burkholderia sp. 8Y]|uniref:hypothetical protein n=1 Tax=Burkholderia sp. 8Y TaxID=2653133 RepID=UPI0012F203B2|nr:hypothetical protein [Burkholderia sp. 8Y]VXC25191.1 conserved hypothetical protein [Burkholderia sp. 8Y]
MADSFAEFVQNRRARSNDNQGSIHKAISGVRYVRLDEDTHGTVGARIGSSDRNSVQLCAYTKVALLKEEGGRIYFRIIDGPYRDSGTASMKTEDAAHYLRGTPPTESNETLKVKYGRLGEENSPFKGRLQQQWGILKVGGENVTVTLNSVWGGRFTPIAPGRHRIMTVDGSHAHISTEGYRNTYPGRIKANDAWFPIELEGTKGNSSRYVHIGHLSEGCVTVHDILKWNTVYDFLISHRLPNTNGLYVAYLEVTK